MWAHVWHSTAGWGKVLTVRGLRILAVNLHRTTFATSRIGSLTLAIIKVCRLSSLIRKTLSCLCSILQAELNGATAVLLGAARGDEAVPGIGHRAVHDVQPHERTTAAGRFMGEPGRNTLGEDVVWVDYSSAVSMHRVRAIDPHERRLERLASTEVEDNRISYGCINVPAVFYENFVQPAFNARYGVVYVLPEMKPIEAVFVGAYDPLDIQARQRALNRGSASSAAKHH